MSVCLAMDTRIISVEFHEPMLRLVGYAHVCSLRGICLRLSRHVAFALQRHWRHAVRRSQQRRSRLPPMRHIGSDIWWQRPVHGRLHRDTPLHGDARCSSASSFWAKYELQSHTRGVLHSLAPACCGCVDQFAARRSRTSPAPDACLRAHQDVRSRDLFSCAHDQRVQEKQNKLVQTLRLNHGTTDIHSTEEDTKMEHSESINTESRSSRRTLRRVPKVTTESYPL